VRRRSSRRSRRSDWEEQEDREVIGDWEED
jgi:hypothetical protein